MFSILHSYALRVGQADDDIVSAMQWSSIVTQTHEMSSLSLFTSGAVFISPSPFLRCTNFYVCAIKVTRLSIFREPKAHYKSTTKIPCVPITLYRFFVTGLRLRHTR